VEDPAKEIGPRALNFTGRDLVDIGNMVLGNWVQEKNVARGCPVSNSNNLCANNMDAELWEFLAGAALQKVLSAFGKMPDWAFSRAIAGISFGRKKC
jgi:hypothetical protein